MYSNDYKIKSLFLWYGYYYNWEEGMGCILFGLVVSECFLFLYCLFFFSYLVMFGCLLGKLLFYLGYFWFFEGFVLFWILGILY